LVLRVEDTDTERTLEDSCRQILDSLKWLGLNWDEGPEVGGPYGPYWQSQRKDLYRESAMELLETGLAYHCYCSPQELEQRRNEARKRGEPSRYDGRCREITSLERQALEAQGRSRVLRLRTPYSGATIVSDLIGGNVTFDNLVIGDFVIMKSDGMPTYNFACVVDDAGMKITHVIRGDEHVSNTPRQVMIYQALDLPVPAFAHVPMILAADRSKLSKRHGATSVEEFREAGFLPEAILNYLVLLGWSPGDDQEFMDIPEMVDKFSLDRISSTPAIYDVTKLAWMNGHYLRQADPERLAQLSIPHLQKTGLVPADITAEERAQVKELVFVVSERVRTLEEVPDAISYFLSEDWDYDQGGVVKHFSREGVLDLLEKAYDVLKQLPDFSLETVESAYRGLIDTLGISGGFLIHPTRLALTGRTVGPGLFHIMSLLGKDTTLRRLKRAIEWVRRTVAENNSAQASAQADPGKVDARRPT
jgi:glutamyl-tRNA synthetase